MFFADAMKVCELLFSERVKKSVLYFGLYQPSLDFQRREDQINIVYESKFIFLNLDS